MLAIAGVLAALFFLGTDPRWGLGTTAGDVVDVRQESLVGTIVGLAGSAAVFLMGLWLMSRRTA